MRKMMNNFYIIKLIEENKILANGLTVKETRGKQDIVTGEIISAPDLPYAKQKALVWFPLYAANPITIDGNALLAVHQDDIIQILERKHTIK